MASLFLPDAESLGLEQERQGERKRGVMRIIAYAVPAFVACAFFLYVAIQFHRDETRPRRAAGTQPAAPPTRRVVHLAAAGTVRRGPSRKSNTASKEKRSRASQPGEYLQGRGLKIQQQDPNSNRIPYIEMLLPVAAVVTPVTNLIEGAHDTPPRRIA